MTGAGRHATPAIWSHERGPRGAPLVVLVHGAMDRSGGLLKLSRRLDPEARVLRYDRRGYGRSAPHPGPFTMTSQVDDLVALLDGRPAVLVGHSFGGNVALATADRRPDLVQASLVYEAPLSWLPWWPADTAGALARSEGGRARSDPAEVDPPAAAAVEQAADAAERLMRRLIGDVRWERLPPSTRAARRAEGVPMLAELDDLAARAPWRAERITMPVVAVRGELGRPHHHAATEHLASILPECHVREVAGARHFGPNTHPDDVAVLVRELASRAGVLIGEPGHRQQPEGDDGAQR